MTRLLFLIVFIFSASPVFAQSQDLSKDIIDISNKVILEIFQDIQSLKPRYKELSEFNEDCLKVNKYGIYMINYSHADKDETLGDVPYAFGLTVVPSQDKVFAAAEQFLFEMGFPLLDVKFAGYKIINFKSKQYDINTSIQKIGSQLWDYQQNFIPLKLSLKSNKETFKTGENIEFTVSLKNDSNQNWRIKDLGADTLYFIYDNRSWGASEAGLNQGNRETILKAHQTISKQFRGGSFPLPRELEIHCTYNLPFKGIKPTSSLKLQVVE